MKVGFRHRRRGMIDRILMHERALVARMLASAPLAPSRVPGGGVVEAMRRTRGDNLRVLARVRVMRRDEAGADAEVAPSAVHLALTWARSGAAAIVVPTDRAFLGGSFAELAACRAALDAAAGRARPRLVCEDFVIDPVQLGRAVDAGADAVLLIARLITPEVLRALIHASRERGLEPLVEVATTEEIGAARDGGALIVCVSGCDRNTGRIDPDSRAEVLAGAGDDLITIEIDGAVKAAGVARMAARSVDAALVDASAADPGAMLAASRAPRP